MAEDPQPMTLQQRIAALNAAHVVRVPGEMPLPTSRPKPEVPAQRPVMNRQKTVNIPHEQVNGTVSEIRAGNQPNGPPPLPSRKQPPPLPNRNSSDESSRRTSVTSTTSISTNGTNSSRALVKTKSRESDSRVKAPAWGEVELPALPAKNTQPMSRSKVPERPKYTSRTSQQSVSSQRSVSSPLNTNSFIPPPPLPTRKSSGDSRVAAARKLPPVPTTDALEKAKRSAFSNNSSAPEPEPAPAPAPEPGPEFSPEPGPQIVRPPPRPSQRPSAVSHATSQPPPVPFASRPDLSAIQATKPRPSSGSATNGHQQSPSAGQSDVCLTCRDFTGPDHHASLFPRQQVTSLPYLAQQLTAPFPSPTDKARAIFTWLHHNVAYDVDRFFGGNLQPSTPQSTLQSGLAVCEGYAALFANLATHAGLEALVISGHGKGFGYSNLAPGASIPPYDMNHAWSVVKIDNGEWKLVDACWGAGHVQGAGMPYVKQFNATQFAMSNEEFGTKHFPGNKDHFFLPGGRQMSWEEYMRINPDSWPYYCEPPTIFTNARVDYSIGERTVFPRDRKIQVNDEGIVRFQFGLICPHWTLDKHAKKGLPPVFILGTHGVDGRKNDHIPLQHVRGSAPGGGGDQWYVDVPARELGAPGQTLTLFAITTFGTRKDARGLSVREFREGKGRVGMSFTGIAAWDLV